MPTSSPQLLDWLVSFQQLRGYPRRYGGAGPPGAGEWACWIFLLTPTPCLTPSCDKERAEAPVHRKKELLFFCEAGRPAKGRRGVFAHMEGVPWCHVVDDTAAAAGISYSQPGIRSGITHLGTSRQPLLIWPSWGTPAGPAHPATGALPFGATWLARWRVERPLRAPHDTADKLERAHPAGRIWAALRPILRGFNSI